MNRVQLLRSAQGAGALWKGRRGSLCALYTAKTRGPGGRTARPRPGSRSPWAKASAPDRRPRTRTHVATRRSAAAQVGPAVAKSPTPAVQPRPTSCSRMPTPSHTLPVGADLSTSFGVKHWSLDPQFPRKLVGRLNFQRSAIRLSNLPLALSDSISTPGDPKTSSEPRSIDSGETIQFRPLLRGDI